jgi:hypothetical protein
MDEIFTRVWTDLVARTQGPLWFRLILQPLVAIVFGVRAGLRNARRGELQGTPEPAYRREMLRQAWGDLGKVVLIGIVLDVVVQWMTLRTVWPGETLLVVLGIVVLPYQVIRTAVARLARGRRPAQTG